jgi:hypothetical protein
VSFVEACDQLCKNDGNQVKGWQYNTNNITGC